MRIPSKLVRDMAVRVGARSPTFVTHEPTVFGIIIVDNSFDYVVIGAGSAGCVVASRLSEDTGVRVALLEAGSSSGPVSMSSANNLEAMQLLGSCVDWGFTTTPQIALDGAVLDCPRGKVLGGSSSINGLLHVRGHASSYDAWEAQGAKGWNYEGMLPYLKRSECTDGRDPNVRGTAGPMLIEEPPAANPLAQALYQAAVETGYPEIDDGNGSPTEGVSWLEYNVVNNKRQSAADAYLRPVMSRPNLTVVTAACVTRLIIDGSRCSGAQYYKGGNTSVVHAERGVILCAGVIGSPKILMLSGIGPAARLRDHGIAVLTDLPGVGENLQDHPIALVSHDTTQVLEATPSRLPSLISRSDEHADPDLFFTFVPAAIEPRWRDAAPGFSILFALVRPRSRGSVRLRSSDPLDAPLIDPAYLTESNDIDRMVVGLQMAREIAHASVLKPWRGTELLPGAEIQSDDDCRAILRRTTASYLHLAGTCRIGTDDRAVVDPQLRVRGIDNLRVVDASVMPSLVAAPPNAAILAIAERAADLINSDSLCHR
jgi:choline dehydrogenase